MTTLYVLYYKHKKIYFITCNLFVFSFNFFQASFVNEREILFVCAKCDDDFMLRRYKQNINALFSKFLRKEFRRGFFFLNFFRKQNFESQDLFWIPIRNVFWCQKSYLKKKCNTDKKSSFDSSISFSQKAFKNRKKMFHK